MLSSSWSSYFFNTTFLSLTLSYVVNYRRLWAIAHCRVSTQKYMNGVYSQIHEQRNEFETNMVYNIPCANYPWSYIGATVKVLFNEEKEHFQKVKIC